MKYTEAKVTFAEIPTEINLCLSISNCDGRCANCHSPELRENIGADVEENILAEIDRHPSITCVCFLGEGKKNPNYVNEYKRIVKLIRDNYPNLRLAIYGGSPKVQNEWMELFDYIKVGPYEEDLGPLTSLTTNQRLYRVVNKTFLEDITYMFHYKGAK